MTNIEKACGFYSQKLVVLSIFLPATLWGCGLGLGQKIAACKVKAIDEQACAFWSDGRFDLANGYFVRAAQGYANLACTYDADKFSRKQARVFVNAGRLNYSAARWQDAADFFVSACKIYQAQGQYSLAAEYLLNAAHAKHRLDLIVASVELRIAAAHCYNKAKKNAFDGLENCGLAMQDLLFELEGRRGAMVAMAVVDLISRVEEVVTQALTINFSEKLNPREARGLRGILSDQFVNIAFAFVNLNKNELAQEAFLKAINYATKCDMRMGENLLGGDAVSATQMPLLNRVWVRLCDYPSRAIFEQFYAPMLQGLAAANLMASSIETVNWNCWHAADLLSSAKRSTALAMLDVFRKAAIKCENQGDNQLAYKLLDFLSKQYKVLGLDEQALQFQLRAKFRNELIAAHGK